MDEAVRKFVRERAEYRCEYCGLHEDDDAYTFHVEHIVARKHGGSDDDGNLALACQQCNLHKGPNLSGIDPPSRKIVELFHPRKDVWVEHFSFQDYRIAGLTPSGRATVHVLNMNDLDRINIREALGNPSR
jgi:hypothetical protein